MDITCLFPEDVTVSMPSIRGWWERMLMGFAPSPYQVTKDLMKVEMMIRGDRKAVGNIFGWKKVVLNLPGTSSYDPSMPWVYKVRGDNKVATYLFFYIDDGRPTSGSAKDCWKATQRVCQILCYLGIQDACRKRTSPSKEPGEWEGTSVDASII